MNGKYRIPYYKITLYGIEYDIRFDSSEWEEKSVKRFMKELTPPVNQFCGELLTEHTTQKINQVIHDFIHSKINSGHLEIWDFKWEYINNTSECLNCMTEHELMNNKRCGLIDES